MKILIYSKYYKNSWDDFVKKAKNSHFFFQRDYMEYHKYRFNDFSLVILNDKEKIIAILPANISGQIIYSHQGLTFGGFLYDNKMTAKLMLEVFNNVIEFYKKYKINKIIYKAIPYIYHTLPSQEDLYALFRVNGKIVRRDITTTISYENMIEYQNLRKRKIRKALSYNLKIDIDKYFEEYWKLLYKVLQESHNTRPVHKISEILYLKSMFQENIKLFTVSNDNEIIAGTVIYENKNIVHTQYLAISDYGKKIGALDFLIDYLIKKYQDSKKYFDFGISTEDNGRYLNEGLIFQKEGFGGRSVCHDVYELVL